MSQTVKISLAILVFLAGMSFAFFYRRSDTDRLSFETNSSGSLVLRGPRWDFPKRPHSEPRKILRSTAKKPSKSSVGSKSAVLLPMDTGQPPPMIAKVFPVEKRREDLSWEAAGIDGESDVTSGQIKHKIVDGDTLEKLARLYLGDPSLGIEIYEANQGVLKSPYVLPIGVVLLIPQPGSWVGNSEGLLPDKPLVPVDSALE